MLPTFNPVHRANDDIPLATPRWRVIGTERPWAWLGCGWRDILRAPQISLGYGVIAMVASYLLVAGLSNLQAEFLILPLSAGFMLLGPLLAAGLYEVSRRLEAGEPVSFGTAFSAYTRNASQVLGVGLILMLAFLAWIRIAMLLFALFFSDLPPGLDYVTFIERVFFSDRTLSFLVSGTAVGFLLALIVFSLTAVSIPLLVDRDVGAITAVVTSTGAVRSNAKAMSVWAVLIVLFIGAGMATAFIGLIVAFPLIGHATWHAYRDLVVPD